MSDIIAGDPAPTNPTARDWLLNYAGNADWRTQVDRLLTQHRAEVLNDVASELAKVDFNGRAKGNYDGLAAGFVRRFRRRAVEVAGGCQDTCDYVRGISRDCTCGGAR
ncbi:hypothetical protein ACFWNE_07780 [Streptomyces goshikiensis]|uniref:hypothetical protein n=1 Tax=Streptomyces goshikiensis TaxID=1942 RepID=UPI003662A384